MGACGTAGGVHAAGAREPRRASLSLRRSSGAQTFKRRDNFGVKSHLYITRFATKIFHTPTPHPQQIGVCTALRVLPLTREVYRQMFR